MKLKRLYAYEILPQKGIAKPNAPTGGQLKIGKVLEDALNSLVVGTGLLSKQEIEFTVTDPKTAPNQNEARDIFMKACFGPGGTKLQSTTLVIAQKLAMSMDGRSNPFLLLISCFESGGLRRLVLWAFPKDSAFRFNFGPSGASIEMIPDIFSVSSSLRKAAVFEGKNRSDSFWAGRVLDIQSGRTNFWIEDFLQCSSSLKGVYGTEQLAGYVSAAFKKVKTEESREELYNAIVAIRTSPKKNISYESFAKDYLSDEARTTFLSGVPVAERNMIFKFSRDVFEKKIGFRSFQMRDSVYVSAPFNTIGESVIVDNKNLTYSGEIEQEFLRKTQARS